MKSKKSTLSLLIAVIGIAIVFLQFAPPPPPGVNNPDSFEQFPPIPTQYWVEKLVTPLTDSSNIIMRIRYISDTTLPSTITVYRSSGDSTVFHDDGLTCDSVNNDGIYAAYMKEDLSAFTSLASSFESNLTNQGSFIEFRGHTGKTVDTIPSFDLTAFNNYEPVEISARLINGADCGNSILKQNSLFITALSVVEDPARTFNVVTEVGNPTGEWTFGQLVKNIVNGSSGDTKAFLKAWVEGWPNGRTINGQSVAARTYALNYLIYPWLERANNLPSSYFNTYSNWEYVWANTSEDDLLKYAPFKLMAIVNRMDLRGNDSYKMLITNSGETRFIFTLIAPLDYASPASTATIPKGTVPFNDGNTQFGNPDLLDWRGMNVILEYGNPQNNSCDVESFAQNWVDLSAYDLHDAIAEKNDSYNDALAAITSVVTSANAAPGKPNGSALKRIRTNERIFFESNIGVSSAAQNSWSASTWEMSQFELDGSGSAPHNLVPVAVTNTPQADANVLTNLNSGGTYPATVTAGTGLIDWVYKNKNLVTIGNHLLPVSYSASAVSPYNTVTIAPVAHLSQRLLSFWDLYFTSASTTYYSHLSSGSTSPLGRDLRHQLSLNTCQGCHGAENKTIFTQVRPSAYGESNNYWDATPAYDLGPVDTRFTYTIGTSKKNGTLADVYPLLNATYLTSFTNVYAQRVSSFLTGRQYSGSSNWQDDNTSSTLDDPYDDIQPNASNSNKQLFYVYDQADLRGGSGGASDLTFPKPDDFHGFNDLERRKQDLCHLITVGCGKTYSLVFQTIGLVNHMPLATE